MKHSDSILAACLIPVCRISSCGKKELSVGRFLCCAGLYV